MNRFWALLFLLVPLLGTASYLLAAFQIWPCQGLWLPENYSQAGKTIDFLFNLIHVICAVILLGTGFVLALSINLFGAPSRKAAAYFSHNTKLEIIWSIIPGGILVFIALYQFQSWEENKMIRPVKVENGVERQVDPLVKVVARRFGWEFYHAGLDGKLETIDDVYVENELIVPADEDVVLAIESRDVLHSFFVPTLRLKQDIIPGLTQLIWFNANQSTETTIVCAELCGWGHYTMQARMKIVSRADYDRWLASQSISKISSESKNSNQ